MPILNYQIPNKVSFFSILIIILFSCNDENGLGTSETATPIGTSSNDLFAVDIGASEIPYITITTNGQAIENEPKIAADLKVYMNETEIQSQTIGIEFRGSTSFRLSEKKSFGVETWDADGNDVDVAFFDFPAEEDWVLIGDVVSTSSNFTFDRTLLYNHFAYQVFAKMDRYASRTQLVELELNGEYLGIYVFMEKLKRDKERIDIKKLEPSDTSITGGYILKIDKTAGGDLNLNQPLSYFESNWADDATYNPNISFRSRYDINGEEIDFSAFRPAFHNLQFLETYFLYEYPKADIITTDQKQYIQQYIFDFETALLTDDFTTTTRTYTDFIDTNSFIDFFIINELCKNVDGYRLSTYLQKDRDGKLAMGPIWDFNIGFDISDRVPDNDWVINYNNFVEQDAWMVPFWWPRLLSDPMFQEALKTRWQELRSSVLQTSELIQLVDQDANYLINNGAINRNQQKWNTANYNESIESLKNYLEARTAWMDSQINSF